MCDRKRTEKIELSLIFYGHFHVECVLKSLHSYLLKTLFVLSLLGGTAFILGLSSLPVKGASKNLLIYIWKRGRLSGHPHSVLPQLGISANNCLGHSHTTSCQKGDPICPSLPLASWPAPSATEEMLLRKCCTSVATPRACQPQVEGAMPQPRWPAVPILPLALGQGHLGPPSPSNLDVFRFKRLSAHSLASSGKYTPGF